MFNETQKDLLIEARKRIEAKTQQFICIALSNACQSTSAVKYDIRWEESGRLKEEIEFGIDGYSSLELWLFSETGIYPDDLVDYAREFWDEHAFVGWTRAITREEFEDLCRMARLAWIDRALENGSLA